MSGESFTWQEIVSQPETWRATLKNLGREAGALGQLITRLKGRQVVFVGCGSTHYLSLSASTCLMDAAGARSRALPSSEVWLYPERIQPKGSMLVAVSRSGTTTETLWAVREFRKAGGGPVVAITCCPESELARSSDVVLSAPAAQERSIAQTRSFTSMLILCQALAGAAAAGSDGWSRLGILPDRLEDLTQRIGDLPERVGRDLSVSQMVFLGGGPLFGLASEAMLKTMEMSLTDASAFYPLEFRHGPKSLTGRETLVVGLLDERGARCSVEVLADLQQLGARTLVVAEDASRLGRLKPDFMIELHSGLQEWERLPLFLPPLQRLAFHRAIAKGLDPDRPRHLTAVVELHEGGSAQP